MSFLLSSRMAYFLWVVALTALLSSHCFASLYDVAPLRHCHSCQIHQGTSYFVKTENSCYEWIHAEIHILGRQHRHFHLLECIACTPIHSFYCSDRSVWHCHLSDQQLYDLHLISLLSHRQQENPPTVWESTMDYLSTLMKRDTLPVPETQQEQRTAIDLRPSIPSDRARGDDSGGVCRLWRCWRTNDALIWWLILGRTWLAMYILRGTMRSSSNNGWGERRSRHGCP